MNGIISWYCAPVSLWEQLGPPASKCKVIPPDVGHKEKHGRVSIGIVESNTLIFRTIHRSFARSWYDASYFRRLRVSITAGTKSNKTNAKLNLGCGFEPQVCQNIKKEQRADSFTGRDNELETISHEKNENYKADEL